MHLHYRDTWRLCLCCWALPTDCSLPAATGVHGLNLGGSGLTATPPAMSFSTLSALYTWEGAHEAKGQPGGVGHPSDAKQEQQIVLQAASSQQAGLFHVRKLQLTSMRYFWKLLADLTSRFSAQRIILPHP